MPTQNGRTHTWEIYEHDALAFEIQQGTRVWEIERDDYEDEDSFRGAVAAELAALENMGERMGRGFLVAPIRIEISPGTGRYVTHGWRFQDAFVPAAKFVTADEPVEVEPAEAVA